MKYYVVADIHGFYDEFIAALVEKGFFTDSEPHKLIVCGDLFDRGMQAYELQKFILDLLAKNEVILIRGNHEDLALELLNEWANYSYLKLHHYSNGTIDTVCQLLVKTLDDLNHDADSFGKKFLQNPYIQTIIPAMLDYYETEHYIFVHGWIPCTVLNISCTTPEYIFIDNWRNSDKKAWDKARWLNGMEAAHSGVTESGKTIVCGHWHCSFGHSHYEGEGGEFDNNPNFTPYYGNGIIALDTCTAISRKVNCIVIDD